MILTELDAYYTRDKTATKADVGTVKALLQGRLAQAGVYDRCAGFIDGLPKDVSSENVAQAVANARIRDIKLRLAECLMSDGDARPLLAELAEAQTATLTVDKTQLQVDDLIRSAGERTIVHPALLNEAFGGGIPAGRFIVVMARPGLGKSLICCNLAGSFLHAGHATVHVINEESDAQIYFRYLSLLARVPLNNLQHPDPELREKFIRCAWDTAMSKRNGGLKNLHIVWGVTEMGAVEALAEKLSPGLIIVDQIRHMRYDGAESLHQSLEQTCQDLRELCVRRNLVGIGVTQAGEKAIDKMELSEGDVDGAKTGLQGACDAIVAMGATPEMRRLQQRCISVVRNKISGALSSFIVQLDEQRTLMTGGTKLR